MQVLICGYIGGGNCGDEAICDRLIDTIRSSGDEATLVSLSPAESQSLHRIKAVYRYSPALLRALRACDLLILGGGTLLQTATSRRSALAYLTLAAMAAMLHKPWVLLGGLDPLSGVARRYARAILPTAAAFFLRDRDSLRRAKASAPRVPCLFLQDCALFPLKGVPSAKDARPRPYILICPKAGICTKTVQTIILRAKARRVRWVFLAMSKDDEGISAALAKALGGVWVGAMTPYAPAYRRVRAEVILKNLPPRSPHRYFAALPCEIACRLIGSAEAVYSARLHGLIFAQKAGVKGYALSDGTKQWKFCATQEQNDSFEGLP